MYLERRGLGEKERAEAHHDGAGDLAQMVLEDIPDGGRSFACHDNNKKIIRDTGRRTK